MTTAYSDALYRVCYAWGVTFVPHAIKIALLGQNGVQWDNCLGRNNLQKDLKLSNPSALARVRRADAAHQNGYESLLFFAPAVVAAVSAGVAADDVDKYTKYYLILRVLYNLIFIFNDGNNGIAMLRTGVWGGSVYCSMTLFLRAARLLKVKGL